ncbi:MAG: hypothetical protein AVDCRST_MAG73-667 [uncultured Thermomicrobiales bacterium]|uniref:NurA domain-containing protein n=1 Tax=uncultured Thermomicrobiales bacterium TaxID=1645740 RepID=A0A6J4TNY1_9BACT|nr:MAG: hypothetical protein AVDCRST_MAG73-667 [uncultured Thermomicrobiales bacterium]
MEVAERIRDAGMEPARSLVEQVAQLRAALARDGVVVADMRRAGSLELQYAGLGQIDAAGQGRIAPIEIERLEGPIRARALAKAPPGNSRLRYFMDGSQRTFPVLRVGLIPIAATVAVAGILYRDPAGRPSIAPGTLLLNHAWLVPRRCPDPQIAALVARLEDQGAAIVDPLEGVEDDDAYCAEAGNYGRMVELAYARAKDVRTDLEKELIERWRDELGPAASGDWLVVDGRLGADAPANAIGLVKSLRTQHLAGAEAEALFGLPQGNRTTAFRYRARRRPGTGADAPSTASTVWYLRLWDPAGQDARHGLVRVEAGTGVQSPAQLDQLSAWLLAERIPRAMADARWATLLYPVHVLEQILKRRVAAYTLGWAGDRG